MEFSDLLKSITADFADSPVPESTRQPIVEAAVTWYRSSANTEAPLARAVQEYLDRE